MKPEVIVHGNGINNDYEALQRHYAGEAMAVHLDGTPYPVHGAVYRISKTIEVPHNHVPHNVFHWLI